MAKIFKNLMDLIGKTPLLEFSNYEKKHKLQATMIGKLEYFNPTGSVGDRIVRAMIEDAKEKGLLNPESVIIEPTSGSAGIGLASMTAAHGYHIVPMMPETMSVKHGDLLKVCDAEFVLTEGAKGVSGTIAKAEELAQEIPHPLIPGQFVNPTSPDVHRKTTGSEIWESTDGKIDIPITGVGTGGTLTGAGESLRSKNPNVKVIAAELDAPSVLSEDKSGPHRIQGIGAGFMPKVPSTSIYDEIIRVKNEDTLATDKELSKEGGLLVGISSGATIWTTTELTKRPEDVGKMIVVVLSDTGERYLSAPLFSE